MPPTPTKKIPNGSRSVVRKKKNEVEDKKDKRDETDSSEEEMDFLKKIKTEIKCEIKDELCSDDEEPQDDSSSPLTSRRRKKNGKTVKEKPNAFISSDSESSDNSALRDSSEDEEDIDDPAESSANSASYQATTNNKKHTCLQSEIITQKNITGTDHCEPGKPAVLPLQKVKLHYVVHYLHRGAFNHIVPEVKHEEKARIEGYDCKICGKKFKNNVAKEEYPARGSIICHLATEHGKILEIMSSDKEVEMKPVIELLRTYDPQSKAFLEKGTKTKHDGKLVTVRESPFWRIKAQQKSAVSKKPAEPTPSKTPGPVVNTPPRVFPDGAKPVFSCPKCGGLKTNKDSATLRIHLYQHYKSRWEKSMEEWMVDKDALEISCRLCPSRKKIAGATPSGAKGSMICHLAIQHEELRDALKEDKSIDQEFIQKLYADSKSTDNTGSAMKPNKGKAASVLSVFDKNFAANQKRKTTKGRKSSAKKKRIADDSSESEGLVDETTSSEEEEGGADPATSSDDREAPVKTTKNKSSKVNTPKSGELNNIYIKKRAKINFTLTSDEDSDNWSDNERKSGGGKQKKSVRFDKTRTLPKRASAAKAKPIVDQFSDEEFDDEEF